MPTTGHMTFQRFGRSYHLKIRAAKDLSCILDLNEAHWVASGAPTASFNCDETFLDLLDTDDNHRLMCFELRDSVAWLLDTLSDFAGIDQASTSLSLAAINADSADGKRVRLSATRMLNQLGKAGADHITLEQVRKVKSKVEDTPVSEAGVVLPEASKEETVKQFIADIVATIGGVPHPSGEKGVNEAQLDEFIKEAKAHLEWHEKGLVPTDKSDIMPLGANTPGAFKAYSGLRDKVDQYFAQSKVVSFDKRAVGHVGPSEADLESADLSDPDKIAKLMKGAPLAEVSGNRALALESGGNPYYAEQLEKLCSDAIKPALQHVPKTLSEKDWNMVKQFFAAHEAWLSEKAGSKVESLGMDKLNKHLDEKAIGAIRTLIAESAETALELDNIRLSEKLILYQAHMISLVNNFVSFPHLYDPANRAMFEMGTLVMDGRRFNFSMKVEDRSKHSALAKTSNIYVMYAEIAPGNGKKPYDVAIPVTCGGKGNLCVGKRGVFLSTAGEQCDARITQIIENPISLREALVSPFQRIGKLLTGKIEAIATSAEKKVDAAAASALSSGAAPAKGGAPSGLMAGGLLMGGGVALAAVGSALAYITRTLGGMEAYKIVIGVCVALLAVAAPISIMALLKLRGRDLSAILEGSGWAINARMRLTLKQGRIFTESPRYPRSAKGIRNPRLCLLLAIIIALEALLIGWILSLPWDECGVCSGDYQWEDQQ